VSEVFKYIWLKEIHSELYTWKSMLWLLVFSLMLSLTSYLLLTNQELSLLDQTELLWLLSKIIIGAGLLLITIDASSIIAGEFESETAESLFLAPLTPVQLVFGKLLASLTLWAAIFIVSIPYILVASAGSHLALAFIGYTCLLGTICVLSFIILTFAASFLLGSSKNTLTTSLIILLALAIPATFSSTLKNNPFSAFLSEVNPIDNVFASLDNVLVDYQTSLSQNWHYVLALLVFCFLCLVALALSLRRFTAGGMIKKD
jgi:ABC-type transport system involved in multi-copper enzyme maturation permease subunit